MVVRLLITAVTGAAYATSKALDKHKSDKSKQSLDGHSGSGSGSGLADGSVVEEAEKAPYHADEDCGKQFCGRCRVKYMHERRWERRADRHAYIAERDYYRASSRRGQGCCGRRRREQQQQQILLAPEPAVMPRGVAVAQQPRTDLRSDEQQQQQQQQHGIVTSSPQAARGDVWEDLTPPAYEAGNYEGVNDDEKAHASH